MASVNRTPDSFYGGGATFIGETLGVGLTERPEGTLAANAFAAADGARKFRVHEVGPTRWVLEMAASIKGDRPPARTVRGLA